MPILPHKRHSSVLKCRNNHSTTRMVHHFALIGLVAFAHGIDRHFEDTPAKNLFAVFSKLKCPVFLASEMSGVSLVISINLPSSSCGNVEKSGGFLA